MLFNVELFGEGSLFDILVELVGVVWCYLCYKFLMIKMVVLGVNFVIVEIGMVCVVELEGNGCMCLMMLEVFVSIMGIEKVLEKVEDISVFMELFLCSFIVECMNFYNLFWSGVIFGDGL